jgi:hypothetical protein
MQSWIGIISSLRFGGVTVLGYFGFDRTTYGNGTNRRARKWRWLQELKQERERNIKTEIV